MDSLLSKLGAGGNFAKTQSVKDLHVGQEYPLLSMRKVNTRFGLGVVAVLDECSVFLPKRFASLGNDEIEKINTGPQIVLVYRGIKENGMYILEFKEKQ